MKYYKVECGNGYCGCDETFVTMSEDELTFEDVLNMYTYESGFAGCEDGYPDFLDENDEFSEELYYDAIGENSYWDEITEEEYNRLVEEEREEER